MNIKYAIFDLDGTLLDTIESLIKTGNSMLKNWGMNRVVIKNLENLLAMVQKN